MRISDWSSDVCSSDLRIAVAADDDAADDGADREDQPQPVAAAFEFICIFGDADGADVGVRGSKSRRGGRHRSEEHTSELQSLMRNPYAVSGLTKTKKATSN